MLQLHLSDQQLYCLLRCGIRVIYGYVRFCTNITARYISVQRVKSPDNELQHYSLTENLFSFSSMLTTPVLVV